MARQIAVSFEDNIIKVVYATSNRGKLTIKKTLIFKDEEFDDFLKREKALQFTLVYNFKTFYQDILPLPTVKEKFFKNIIASEIRKKYPKLKDFSFFHTVLGEKIYEGKKMKETFIFAVDNHDLNQVSDRFTRYGKKINYLYPNAFIMTRLANLSHDTPDEPVLCIAEFGTGKNLCLSKNGILHFVRTAQSFESGIHDIDAQNINMTINYCRQTLKSNPSRVILIGNVCYNYETVTDLMAPVVSMLYPANIVGTRETISEFIIPISALLNVKDREYGNLLPQRYRNFYRQKSVLTYYTAIFLLLSITGLGYLKIKVSEITTIKNHITSLRDGIGGMESIRQDYEDKNKEFQRFIPLIDFVNNLNSSPDAQKALIALSNLKGPNPGNMYLNSIDIKASGDKLQIQIKGDIKAEHFTDMQQSYQDFINAIKKTEGMELLSDRIELKDKSFQIELKYR